LAEDYISMLKKLDLSKTKVDQKTVRKLKSIAWDTKDQLTGLLDYRSFSHRLQQLVDDARPCTLVGLGIDLLQELNLISGWVVGDIALCIIAGQLENLPQGSFAGRLAGTSFICYIPNDHIPRIKKWLAEVIDAVAEAELPGLDMFPEKHLTLSIGIYSMKSFDSNAELAIMETQKRLVYAKQQGGNQIATIAADQNITETTLPAQLSLKLYSNSKNEALPANLLKLSVNGFSCSFSQPLLVREQIQAEFLWEDEVYLSVQAVVVWRKSEIENIQFPFNLGLKFAELSDEQRQFLENIITGNI